MSAGLDAHVVVLMGVAGAGKTTVGRRLAESLGWTFVDADAHHSAANIAKMRRGDPLDDIDRAPWLASLAERVRQALDASEGLVLACSALKRAYRAALLPLGGDARVRFVYLRVSRDALAPRLAVRAGHFATATLLESQLATLEEPAADEAVLVVDGEQSVDDAVTAIRTSLAR